MHILKKLLGKQNYPHPSSNRDTSDYEIEPKHESELAQSINKVPVKSHQAKTEADLNPISNDFDWDTPHSEQAKAVKEALLKYEDIRLFNDDELDYAHKYIVQGIVKGEAFKTTARNLSNATGRDLDTCLDLVHTVMAQASTDSEVKRMMETGFTQYQILCTLDGKTCLTCGVHDLKIYSLGKGPLPPFHKNCRCVIIPVIPGYDPTTGKRSARDGIGKKAKSILVPAGMTYTEWREIYGLKAGSEEPNEKKQ